MKNNKLVFLNSVTLVMNVLILLTIFNKGTICLVTNNFLLLICIMFNISCYNKKFKINKKHLFVLGMFSLISLMLPLYNTYFFNNIKTTILLLSNLILLYFFVATQNDRSIIMENCFKIFSIITEIFVIYGLIIYLFGNQSIYQVDINSTEYFQSYTIAGIKLIQSACGDLSHGFYVGSLTNNPNSLSYICIFSLVYVLFFKTFNLKKIIKIIILFTGVLISGSRLATILFPIIILIRIFLHRKNFVNTRKTVFLYYAFFIFILLLAFNFNSISGSIDYNGRLENWTIGLKNVSLIGHGINSDNIYLNNYLSYKTSMHNSYISLLVNYGIIFSIIICLFFFITLKKMLLKYELSKEDSFVFVLFLILMIVSLSESTFLVYGCFNTLFFYLIFYSYLEVKE